MASRAGTRYWRSWARRAPASRTHASWPTGWPAMKAATCSPPAADLGRNGIQPDAHLRPRWRAATPCAGAHPRAVTMSASWKSILAAIAAALSLAACGPLPLAPARASGLAAGPWRAQAQSSSSRGHDAGGHPGAARRTRSPLATRIAGSPMVAPQRGRRVCSSCRTGPASRRVPRPVRYRRLVVSFDGRGLVESVGYTDRICPSYMLGDERYDSEPASTWRRPTSGWMVSTPSRSSSTWSPTNRPGAFRALHFASDGQSGRRHDGRHQSGAALLCAAQPLRSANSCRHD